VIYDLGLAIDERPRSSDVALEMQSPVDRVALRPLSARVAGTWGMARPQASEDSDAPALRWSSEFSQRENCHLHDAKMNGLSVFPPFSFVPKTIL